MKKKYSIIEQPILKQVMAISLVIGLVMALPAGGTQFGFDPSRGLVELEATVNGYLTGRFGLDTGADRFYLDREFAKRARIAISEDDKTRIVRGIDGDSRVGYATLRSFDIQGERIYNVPVDVIDLNSLSGGDWKAPDGLIGYSALRRFYITVDYPNKKFDLYTHELNYSAEEVIGIPFDLQGHLIVVNVSINGSKPLRFFLDYCASMTIISPDALARVGQSFPTGDYSVAGEMKIVGENEIITHNVTFYARSFSDLGKSYNFTGIDGILGYSFLASHKITVDYRRELLLFHR